MPDTRFAVTHGEVLRIALPMMLTYLSTPLVGLVATGVIARTGGEAEVGGIALAAVIFDVIFVTFNFLRGATTGFTAQAVGAGDRRAEQKMLLGGLAVALAGGLTLLLLHAPLRGLALDLLGAEGAVRAAAEPYFNWRIWSAPFALVNFVVFGWVIGRGEAVTALLLQTLLNGLNAGLAIWWVSGLGWGVAGLGAATLVAEAVTAAAGIALILARTDPTLWERPTARDLRRMKAVNADMMVRSFALLLGLSFFTRQSGMLGTEILAANTILLRFYFFGVAFLDGIAAAAEQLAGRAVGARDRVAFDRTVRLTTGWGLVFAGLVAGGFALSGGWVVGLMTPGGPIATLALTFLPYVVALPLAGVIAFQMDGIYIGATWSREMRNLMLLSLLIYVAAWAVLQPAFGNHGLWIALLIFQGIRSIGFRALLPRLAARTFGGAQAAR